MRKQAFTLIELLVVIAIIAILAAILFPVFAQAKEAAKNTALLSNLKQAGLGCIQYCSDNDDLFPLTWQSDANGWSSWQTSVQPYAKNWAVLENPKLTPPSGSLAYWQEVTQFGSLPRAIAIAKIVDASSATAYFSSDWYLFNDLPVKSDGIFGAGLGGDPTAPYGYAAAGSYSQTSLQDISDMVLISEAANWDYFAGMAALTDPFDHCENVPTGYYPETPEYAGPTTTTQPIDGNSGMGNCHYPQGRSTYVAADGSARSGDFGGDIMKVVTLSDGTYAFKRFWAPGQ